MKAPPRLIDDPDVGLQLRADLRRTSANEPRYDVAAGLIALQAAIAGGAAMAPGAAKAATGSAAGKGAGLLAGGGLKLALGAASLAALGVSGAVLWLGARPAPKAAAPAPAQVAAAAVPVARPSPADAVLAPPAEPTLAATAEAEARPEGDALAPNSRAPSPARVAPHRPSARSPSVDDALHREVEQLGRIKALIDGDPAQAYRLAQAGQREFPHGVLRQEREGLLVLALDGLGRHDEARQRARAFAARYPHSPLMPRLRGLLE